MYGFVWEHTIGCLGNWLLSRFRVANQNRAGSHQVLPKGVTYQILVIQQESVKAVTLNLEGIVQETISTYNNFSV